MGCLGKCNCGCCLSSSEIEEIAESVDIEFPNEFVTNHEFENSACCWSASRLTGYTGYSYSLPYLVQTSVIDESAQVSVKITESQKTPASGVQVLTTLEGRCLLIRDEEFPPEDICSTEINCGTVLKTSQDIQRVYAAIGFRTEEIKVAVHKELMVCEEGGPTECRYIVECAVRFSVIQGGYVYSSFTYTTEFSDEFTCCERLDCGTEKPSHDTDFGDDPTEVPPWSYGNPETVWMLRYKTYDSIEDIPEEITFTDSDVNVCTTARCLEGGQFILYAYEPDPFEIEGNSIATIPFDHYCSHCIDLGIVCFPSLDDKPCSRPSIPTFPCDCEDSEERFDANNLSVAGIGGVQNTSFNAIVGEYNGRCTDTPCHQLSPIDFFTSIFDCTGTIEDPGKCYLAATQDNQSVYPGVNIEDRNICNWWDCQDCYFTGYDPVIPPHQSKFSTVDSYSFDHTFTPGTGGGISLVFPTVVIRFNR
jgi:hypothetical protein